MKQLQQRIERLVAWWNGTLPGRTLARYAERHGGLIASGLAYSLLFAFFAGVWTLFSILGLIVSGNQNLLGQLITVLNRAVPGLVSSGGSGNGVVSSATLTQASTTLTWTGAVSLVAFWWTITGWMGATRSGVRDMFDRTGDEPNMVRARLRDTGAALLVGALFVVSAAMMALAAGAAKLVANLLGVGGGSIWTSFTIDIAGFVVTVAADTLLLAVIFGIVTRVPSTPRHAWTVSLLGGAAIAVLQVLGTRLLGGASSNPLLAPFAAIIGVLIWFNLISQIVMLSSALLAQLTADRARRAEVS
ncbi:MAG: YihY/virulence factor BrkB family protein [Pseudoclavibacter sp.]